MSCVVLTDPQRRLLAALAGGPHRADELEAGEVLDEMHRWGWVFGRERVELTGAGHYHAGTLVGGLVGRE